MLNKCSITCLWKTELKEKFCSVKVSELFRHPKAGLIVGGENGVVNVYELPTKPTDQKCLLKRTMSLETKGGPIQTLAVHNVTKLSNTDLIVADSRGMVTVFTNDKILCRKSVSQFCVECLQVLQDPTGCAAVVIGDSSGHLWAFSPYSDLWRLRLGDSKQTKRPQNAPRVKSMLATKLLNQHGQSCHYLLAADDTQHLYFIHQGSIVLTLKTPAVVNAMCAGKFIDPDEIETGSGNSGAKSQNPACEIQVALGTNTGAIYIMTNFEIYTEEFGQVQLPVNCLETLPSKDSSGTDSMLCAGQFSGVCVLKDGKETARFSTSSWVNCLCVVDCEEESGWKVVAGCVDRSVYSLQLRAT